MSTSKRKLAFVFPGFGSQWKTMGAGLLEHDIFRAAVRECDKQLSRNKDVDWHIEEEIQKPGETSRLAETTIGYPCSLAIEIALMELLKSWGIVPDAVIGHSGGETVAAYTAGILDLKDTFTVIGQQTTLLKKVTVKRAMAHISLPLDKVNEWIQEKNKGKVKNKLFIAGTISPKAAIVAGENETITKLVKSLEQENIFCRILDISAPLHTPEMAPYKKYLFAKIKKIQTRKALIPIYSTFRGGMSKKNDYDAAYWTEMMEKPIEYANGIREMLRHGYNIFIEVSPHPVLSYSTREIIADAAKNNCSVISTLKREKDENEEFFDCLARLSTAGCGIDRERWKSDEKNQQRLQAAIAAITADTRDLPDTEIVKKLETSPPKKCRELILQLIEESIQDVLHPAIMPVDDAHPGFFDMGFDSITAVKLQESLARRMGMPLPTTLIFDYPDIPSLTRYFLANFTGTGLTAPAHKQKNREATVTVKEPIAIIGMACRFPGGAHDLDSFWEMLKNGKDTVSEIPGDRWDGDEFYSEELTPGKSITKQANFITGIDIAAFDAGFFNISPKEAKSIDPQQRLLLEVTVEALENAALPLSGIREKEVGVFVGICMDDYKKAHLLADDIRNIDPYSATGSMFNAAAGRVSYFLGIRGPALAVDTACSSSLTALHLAVQALRNRECETALAAGVNCMFSPNHFVSLSQLNTISRDGTCKTFDENADGFGRGEGCGVIVLKRLPDAQKDNDNILAVIKGSALNQDGASAGFTAPNGIAQQEVIAKALEDAGVSPASVDYLEAHGSGTPLGDPIEIQAIHEVYGKKHTMDNPVRVGTVKTNIGHLEAASGTAGIIKTVLALQHQAIPPHIHVTKPNPLIDWEHIPVKINTQLTPWKKNQKLRRAGISGFGLSGSNAHVIIEEPPAKEPGTPTINYPVHILNLSAKNPTALKELVGSYQFYLEKNQLPGMNDMNDICYTASTGRSHYKYRFSAVGKNTTEIKQKLTAFLTDTHGTSQNIYSNIYKSNQVLNKKIVFLFTGQDSQYQGMAKKLYETEPVFKTWLQTCDRLFYKHIDASIIELLYAPAKTGNTGNSEDAVNEAIYAQPIIFSSEYALSKLWQSWGVEPSLVMGHSIGEYAAACTAGIFTLADAVKLVAARGKLMQSITDPGQMVGILASEEKIRALIDLYKYKQVSLAAVNAPGNVTISGQETSIAKIIEKIKQEKIFIQPLNISHAFHSAMMEPYVEKLSRELAGAVFSLPQLPIISTITGRKADKDMCAPDYWSRHICRTVRFYDAVKLAWEEGYQIYIEIGGTAALTGLANQCIPDDADHALFLPSLRKGKNASEQILTSLSQLYLRGSEIDWQQFYKPVGSTSKKVMLPTYPFQRERYWRELIPTSPAILSSQASPGTGPDNPTGPTKEERRRNMDAILTQLQEMVYTLAGLDPHDIDNDTDWFALGMDSLMLTDFRRKIKGKYQVEITLNELSLEYNTLNKMTEYIQRKSPIEEERSLHPPQVIPGTLNVVNGDVLPGTTADGLAGEEISISHIPVVERLMARQMEAMEQHSRRISELAARQLETIKNLQNGPYLFTGQKLEKEKPAQERPARNEHVFIKAANLGPRGLTPQQQRHLEALIARYTRRTRSSKQQTQAYRHVLADSKATVGFNISTKEMLYPLIGQRARGSRVWDIDGNEYIDLTMGFGVYLFGHHPAFITQAYQEQPGDDIQLGPRSYLVGETAELISRLTGMERVAFANTGTEAVMTAIRLARAAAGRTKIVIFSGSYHGHSDGTLAVSTASDGKLTSEPVSPGIPQGVAREVVVLDYLEPRSLEIIQKLSPQLAAVLVEPVQSRYPGVQPGEFLQQLREITKRSGTVLIFDEMITGFRLHPGGAQAYFKVEADICTYGKIIGGGMPIGVIAGKAKYLDGIDGGHWNYGDRSYPQTERTFFGGTFCQHHHTLVAARAVLKYLEQQGPNLQNQLNQRTKQFAQTLNTYFKENNISMRIVYFSSIFRFDITGGMDLFFYHMLEKGIYIWEWRNCFLSTAHTEEDLEKVSAAVKQSIEELEQGGFSLKRTPTANKDQSTIQAKIPGNNYFPMSSVQKRLYALSQTLEGERAYHLPAAWRIHGALAVEKVESVFKTLIHRHETLRTGLELKNDRLVQRVHEPGEVEFSIIYKKSSRENADIRQLAGEVLRPFDLSKPPLMRVSITELTPRHFIFMINFHHTIMDGMSFSILVQDFMRIYQGDRLPPIKMQYKEYAEWEQQYPGSPGFFIHREYWNRQLAGQPPVLELPTDFPRPAALDFAGKTLKFKIQKEKTAKVKKLARQNLTTLNMTWLAIFNVLLFKLTGQEDIVVGIPAAVRDQKNGAFHYTVGMFTNSLALRNYPQGNKSFARFLQEIKIRCLQAYGNREYPYEQLVAHLDSQRDIGHNPIFDVMFSYEDGDQRLFEIPGLTFTAIDVNPGASPFDLFFELIAGKGYLNIGITYRTSLFKEETIIRWEQYFEKLMEEVLQDTGPDTPLASLEILSHREKQQILQEFNDTAVDYPKNSLIHQLFAEQAEAIPDNVALVGKEEEWKIGTLRADVNAYGEASLRAKSQELRAITYKELNERSNRLADLLKEKGLKPDTIAAVMMGRSPGSIIAILAILKAGAAYLPIDPDYPAERITCMLKDSDAKALVTASKLAEEYGKIAKWKASNNIEIVFLDFSTLLPFYPSTLPSPHPHLSPLNAPATSLAYIMYTSGSTGTPKGVCVEHRNVVRLVINTNYVEMTGKTRVLQTGAPVFDATTFETWGPLLNGGRLALAQKEDILDAHRLGQALKRNKINTLWLTSPLFNQLARENCEIFSTLDYLLVGGDVLSPGFINLVREKNKTLKIINGYGPTENTTFSTTFLIGRNFEKTIPIGSPINNSTAFILDRYGKLQPIGLPGELWVGGDGVARGYLNSPELTAEKFCPWQPGGRFLKKLPPWTPRKNFPLHTSHKSYMSYISHKSYIYRTGDLARWLPDGNIEFLGRQDCQLKIRGFRIEPEEIESRLLNLEEIKDAVVLAREDQTGDKYLCAYLVGAPVPPESAALKKTIDTGKLREYLANTLPEYMVPSFFIELEKIPLAPNGKIDRKALPGPGAETAGEYTPPRDDLEKKLAAMWAEVLGLEPGIIGIQKNFFHLGGHSLKGTILAARIEKEFKVKFPINTLFQAPTIKAAAGFIKQAKQQIYEEIKAVEKKEYYPLSSAQKRLYFLEQYENIGTSYNITEMIKIQGNLDKKRFEQAFQLLIRRHEALRTSFAFIDNLPMQIVHDDRQVDFCPEEIPREKVGKDTRETLNAFIRPFDLKKAPLLRIGILTCPDNKSVYYFFLDMHHIIGDGTSMGVLFDDFASLYNDGSKEKLPPLKIQYKDFSHWQNRLFETGKIKEQEEYWMRLYSDIKDLSPLKLPTDYPRPETLSFEGDIYKFTLEPRDTRAFLEMSAACGVTLYMNLAAAFNVLLYKYSGQTDIIVGTGIMGRRHPDLEKVIGMFVNSLAMRNYPAGDKTYREFLASVKENSIKAFENQDLQFEELVDRLGLERDPSRNPLFDVLFVVQNFQEPQIKTQDAAFSICQEYENKASKFDITLYAHEMEDHILFYLEYSTRLFKTSTIEKFARRCIEIIKQVTENKEIKLDDIDISYDLTAANPEVCKSDFAF